MYDVGDVLTRIDNHLPWVMTLTAIAWATGFVQIVEAVRLGHRDRIPAVPAVTTAFLFAHDCTFALRYSRWFEVVDHWYFKVFWAGMLGAVCVEVVLIGQFICYGHRHIAAGLTRTSFAAAYLLMQVVTFVILWWVQSVLDDPLTLVTLTATSIVTVVPLVPWIISRGNASGQSMVFAVAGLVGPGSVGMLLLPALHPSFGTALYYAVVAVQVVVSLAYIALLARYRGTRKVQP
ncbi:MAG: hypothetical protein QOE52_3141 [Mycobacterium sp.]|jgi:hypothetical protein|nr:hypothetical protein [Mycobacterium sp.]MDT5202876.1 hypothetical protein [Mycobacterium sp.]MDT5274245.1 hypothetical protein [Mycobacterium sp.]MDT5309740.1 hypothetical protein [Mycobacterium sp.]MDT5343957.1 hypothetical protein [Mycobacterium sp.]